VGLPVPRQYSAPAQVDRFPVVVKGVKDSGNLRYVNSRQELDDLAEEEAVIQEYIPGEGYGFYALFNHGQIRAMFMHRRLREYPITGGGSTAAQSVYDEDLRQLGTRLLTELKWHGVAMVEFKKDARTGQFMLMEINPKFWGSLDLSISCGVDFPCLAARMALEGDVDPVMEYPLGRRFRWLLPNDTMHVLANPRAAWPFVRDFFDPNTRGNVWLRDPLPTLVQLAMTGRDVAKALAKGRLRYPQGRARVQP
jgi:predicted ATP-grasp superfamily ATP-dependent carboligase